MVMVMIFVIWIFDLRNLCLWIRRETGEQATRGIVQ